MSDFQICRLKGGYRLHRKLTGEPSAICGAKPGKSHAHNMRDRTGWWIYKESFNPVPHLPQFDHRCKICFKAPE